jgi:hypothetical protein
MLELGAWSVETSVLHPRAHGMPSGLKTMLQDMDNIVDCTAFVPAYLKVPYAGHSPPSQAYPLR